MNDPGEFETTKVPAEPDHISPGGVAEIRMLLQFADRGELTHVRVPAGKTSLFGRVHPSAEWFFIVAGTGTLWDGASAKEVELRPRRSVRIAPGTPFQYRAGHDEDLEFLLAAMPTWHPVHHGVLGDGRDGRPGEWPADAPMPEIVDTRGDLVPDAQQGVVFWDPPDPLDTKRYYVAPDGSKVSTFGTEDAGGFAECELPPGTASQAVTSPIVEELWYVLSGSGQICRWWGTDDEPVVTDLTVGTCVALPRGLSFEFRSTDDGLRALMLTMPRWPGNHAAPETKSRAPWRDPTA